ncbi:MAG: hypothetical protein WCJ87_03475 [Burkholderiales bacterium]
MGPDLQEDQGLTWVRSQQLEQMGLAGFDIEQFDRLALQQTQERCEALRLLVERVIHHDDPLIGEIQSNGRRSRHLICVPASNA